MYLKFACELDRGNCVFATGNDMLEYGEDFATCLGGDGVSGAEGMGIFQLIFPVLTFCVSLSCGGIQIAVSRFVAESKSKAQSYLVLISSIIMSLFMSALTCIILYNFAGPISVHIIKNEACAQLLKYASITIPMTAFHSCISGYYLGLKKTFVPAWSAVFEQIVKVIALYVLGIVWIGNGSVHTIVNSGILF